MAELARLVAAGLLHRRPDGEFEAESLHRLRLIQFARSRGISDERLARSAGEAHRGGMDEDLLGELAALVTSARATGQFLVTEDLMKATDGSLDAGWVRLPARRLKALPDPDRRHRGPRRARGAGRLPAFYY